MELRWVPKHLHSLPGEETPTLKFLLPMQPSTGYAQAPFELATWQGAWLLGTKAPGYLPLKNPGQSTKPLPGKPTYFPPALPSGANVGTAVKGGMASGRHKILQRMGSRDPASACIWGSHTSGQLRVRSPCTPCGRASGYRGRPRPRVLLD